MAKLSTILEPGERILHRGSALRKLWSPILWLVACCGFLSANLLAGYWESIASRPLMLLYAVAVGFIPFGVGAAAVVAAGRIFGLGEACLVTDRRIVAKRGLFRSTVDQMALADIEDAGFEGSMLYIRGGGRTLELQAYRNGLGAAVLARILPQWFPDAGRPMARLGKVLQPGETVLFRFPSPWFNRALCALFLGAAGFFLWSGYGSYLRDDGSGVLIMSFFVFLMLSVLPDIRADWRSVVTDRRLLQRFGWDATRYQDIPLADIEADWRSRFAEKLAASWRGQDLDIPASKDAAARVLAAINAAKGAPA